MTDTWRRLGEQEISEVKEGLGIAAVFRGMDAEDLDVLLDYGEVRDAAKGELLIEEGKSHLGLIILVSGRVEVVKRGGAGGREHLLAKLGRGAILGERALLEEMPPIASIRARQDTRYYFLSKKEFFDLAREHGRVAWKIMMAVARVQTRRLEEMNLKVVQLMERAGSSDGLAELSQFREQLFTDWDF